MKNRNCYVYRIKHTPSGKFYIGCRYAEGCHPDDLWTSYFTSSSAVKELIARDGADAFEFEILEQNCGDRVAAVESDHIFNHIKEHGVDTLLNQAIYRRSELTFLNITSEETRLKVSERTKIALSNPDVKLKVVNRSLKMWSDPEFKTRMKALQNTPEMKEANKNKALKQWQEMTDEQKAHIKNRAIETMKGVPKSPEHAKKISETWKTINSELAVWEMSRSKPLRNVWSMAQNVWEKSKFNHDNSEKPWGCETCCRRLNNFKNVRVFWKMFELFKEGWIPKEDPKWCRYFMKE